MGIVQAGDHQEQIRVKGAPDPLLNAVHLLIQFDDIGPDLVNRAEALLSLGHVNIRHITRKQADLLRFQACWPRHGRINQLVYGLPAALFPKLQSLYITQALNARAANPIDPLATHDPPGRNDREFIKALHHQGRVFAWFKVDRPEGLGLLEGFFRVMIGIGFDEMRDRKPGILSVFGGIPYAFADGFFPKLVHHLARGHLEFAGKGVYCPTVIGG